MMDQGFHSANEDEFLEAPYYTATLSGGNRVRS